MHWFYFSDYEAELLSIDSNIGQIDRAIQKLSDKKHKLLSRKEQIKKIIQEKASEKLASQNWERSGKVTNICFVIFKH